MSTFVTAGECYDGIPGLRIPNSFIMLNLILGLLQMEGLQVPSARLTSRRALQKPSLQELSRGGILRLIAELRTNLHTKDQNRGGSQFSLDLTEAGIGDTSHIHCQEGGEKKEIVTSSAKDSTSHNVNRSEEDELVKLECFLHQRDAAIFSCIVYCLVSLIQNPESDQLMVVQSADTLVAAVCYTLCVSLSISSILVSFVKALYFVFTLLEVSMRVEILGTVTDGSNGNISARFKASKLRKPSISYSLGFAE
jgi:hypothetical protein